MKPTLGRIVHYRGRTGHQCMRAAIVSATAETLDPRGVAAGEVPAVDSDTHVHLNVFTPSGQEMWVEYNVPLATGAEIQPGEWSWPARRDL